MTMAYKRWRAVVRIDYGGLDNFPDATTVRHYLAQHLADMVKLDALARMLPNVGLPEQDLVPEIELIQAEQEEAKAAVAELNAWLEKRGLPVDLERREKRERHVEAKKTRTMVSDLEDQT